MKTGKKAAQENISPWEREINELHEFFEGWLGGDLKPTAEEFQRLETVLADGFTLITPDGQCLERDPLLKSLRDAAGTRPQLRIRIEEPQLRQAGASLLVASYQEWQQEGRETRGRLSTVVFRRRKALPNGLEWTHVHETWKAERRP